MSSPGKRTALWVLACLVAGALLMQLPAARGEGAPSAPFWLATGALALAAVQSIRRMAALDGARVYGMLTAALFGVWVVYFWLACMDQAMGQVAVHEVLRTRLKESFFQTADWMRNV